MHQITSAVNQNIKKCNIRKLSVRRQEWLAFTKHFATEVRGVHESAPVELMNMFRYVQKKYNALPSGTPLNTHVSHWPTSFVALVRSYVLTRKILLTKIAGKYILRENEREGRAYVPFQRANAVKSSVKQKKAAKVKIVVDESVSDATRLKIAERQIRQLEHQVHRLFALVGKATSPKEEVIADAPPVIPSMSAIALTAAVEEIMGGFTMMQSQHQMLFQKLNKLLEK